MSEQSTFKIRINDGAEQDLTVATGMYVSAAAAAPAILGIDADNYPVKVTIWAEGLMPEYGPYSYMIKHPGGEACQVVTRFDGQVLVLSSAA